MTYQHTRFFPSVTPQTLKIWADTANLGTLLPSCLSRPVCLQYDSLCFHADAYEQTTWKYMQEHQDTSRFTAPGAPSAASATTSSRTFPTTFPTTFANTNANTRTHTFPSGPGPIEIDSDTDNDDDDIQVLAMVQPTPPPQTQSQS